MTTVLTAPDQETERLRDGVARRIADSSETTKRCAQLASAFIDAMQWSSETEAMAIKALEPIEAEMKRIAESLNPYHEEPTE
jgi:hypothetical protein